MNKIVFPLKLRMKGPEVGDLQVALQLLMDKGGLLADDEGVRRELSAALKPERAKQTYGAATRKLLSTLPGRTAPQSERCGGQGHRRRA